MRHRPILVPTLLGPALVAAACLVLATPAAALQAPARSGQALGLRYLTWPGKVERPTAAPSVPGGLRGPAAVIARRPAAPAEAPSPTVARFSRYGPGAASGLTPASAWLGGAVRTPATPVPVYDAPAAAAQPGAFPAERPPTAAVEAGPTFAADPMAPRRDAPIFRMQGAGSSPQPAPAAVQTAPTPQAPPPPAYAPASGQPAQQGARYYSVHRAAGRQPDATPMPISVYLDSAPIDLAEPPPTPTVNRTPDGRVQPGVPDRDPNLP